MKIAAIFGLGQGMAPADRVMGIMFGVAMAATAVATVYSIFTLKQLRKKRDCKEGQGSVEQPVPHEKGAGKECASGRNGESGGADACAPQPDKKTSVKQAGGSLAKKKSSHSQTTGRDDSPRVAASRAAAHV